ncbi:hypothetical protein chiPu_0003064 [Chiloscyllium punctatum]|uniref:Uncharacterized protein n=1 Tax=Chiloscyllium punctatum TaxID=137246 RepID=A0A401S2R4_CHIPU|nr:hypothetical protein [Chiloscyllium punctatum]
MSETEDGERSDITAAVANLSVEDEFSVPSGNDAEVPTIAVSSQVGDSLEPKSNPVPVGNKSSIQQEIVCHTEAEDEPKPSDPLEDHAANDSVLAEETINLSAECKEAVSLEPESIRFQALDEHVSTEENVVEESTSDKRKAWGSWGTWGKSLLSTATATVGHGLSTVMEKAEASLKIHSSQTSEESTLPKPNEVTKLSDAQEETDSVTVPPSSPTAGSRGMLSTISNVVQSTGKTVITGGLDALEFIGKKTMNVLAESDPGFKKTKILIHRTATLSQVQSVLMSLSGEELETLKKDLISIKEVFLLKELNTEEEHEDKQGDDNEFVYTLTELLFELHVAATPDKLNKARRKAYDWVKETNALLAEEDKELGSEKNNEKENEEEKLKYKASQKDKISVEDVVMLSIESLAEITARCIEQLHKVAELILHGQDVEKSALDQSKILTKLTVAMCTEVSTLSKKFASCLTRAGAKKKAEVLNPQINTILFEGCNSTTYIQGAFQLLLPILQICHLQSNTNKVDN